MNVQPYIFFEGRCEEALAFYRRAIGAEIVQLKRYREAPQRNPDLPPGSDDKIMHAAFRVGDSVVLASDGFSNGNPTFTGFSLTIEADDTAQAEYMFAALADGGEVKQPLIETFFSPRFGMLVDRFGLGWIIVAQTADKPY